MFLAVLGLCCMGFSLVAKATLYLWCAGFSLRWLFLLWRTDSRACRLSSCGSQAWLFHGMWDLPGPGIETMSPALAGRFLSPELPGKSENSFNDVLHLTV